MDSAALVAVRGTARPLSARSVIASTLLGAGVPSLPGRRLVQAGALFGIAEGAIRTALWRMVAARELEPDDGRYRLAGRLLDRKQRVDDSHHARRRPWDGTWELAVVSAERRPALQRVGLRSAAAALHLAELREGIWVRPDNLDHARLPAARAVVEAQCWRFFGAAAPPGLEAKLFDLDSWAERAWLLGEALDAAGAPAEALAPGDLADGFVLSIAVVRHLQEDPLIPDELLPDDWPGDRLRRRYERFDADYKRRLGRWLRQAS